MSRLGRNYLQVGLYTEMLFPEKGVRFISVNNGIDSNNPAENEFTPFLNIMNEWYARDTSKKIKAVFKNRMEHGLRCSGAIPFGFYRKPGDKQQLYVDEEAAPVIRKIFKLAAEGVPVAQIAEILTEEKVLTPAAYQDQSNTCVSTYHKYQDPYHWRSPSVRGILERQEYLGHTVLAKTVKESFKSKRRRKSNPNELLIFPNTHEPIIDQETWDLASKLIKRSPKRVANGTTTQRLSGMVFCADCGARLSYNAPPYHKILDGTARDSEHNYQCSNYRNEGRRCFNHYIKVSALEHIILKAVQSVSQYVLENENSFSEHLMEQWQIKQERLSSDDKKEIAALKNRIQELDKLIGGLYEDRLKSLLPERHVQRLMSQYDNEQRQLEIRLSELEVQEKNAGPKKNDISKFIALIQKYQTVDEVTNQMLYELIDKIVVHAPIGGTSRYRQQQVDVYFSFIGNYLPPAPAVSEEERRSQIDAEIANREKAAREAHAKYLREQRALLKDEAKTNPDAAAKLERLNAEHREAGRKYRAAKKAKLEADPEYLAQKAAKEAARKQKKYYTNLPIYELTLHAENDPLAAEILAKRKRTNAEKNQRAKEKRRIRMATDPEYAVQQKERKKKTAERDVLN